MLPWLSTPELEVDPSLQALRQVPLARLVHKEILSGILCGELQPGEKISDSALAERLGVSRMPVREALRDLESSGLVETRKHTGVFVRMPNTREISELYELRAGLDAVAGRKVAAALPPGLLGKLTACNETMAAAVQHRDVLTYYRANLEFHWNIVSAAGNRELMSMYRGVVQRVHTARIKSLSSDVAMMTSFQDHRDIVEAIRAKEPDRCAVLMSAHVGRAITRVQLASPALSEVNPS